MRAWRVGEVGCEGCERGKERKELGSEGVDKIEWKVGDGEQVTRKENKMKEDGEGEREWNKESVM